MNQSTQEYLISLSVLILGACLFFFYQDSPIIQLCTYVGAYFFGKGRAYQDFDE